MIFRSENSEAEYDFSSKNKYSWRKFLVRNRDIKLTQAEFSNIIDTCNDFLMDGVVEKGKEVKLPYGNGSLQIFKYKPKQTKKTKDGSTIINLPVDWGSTMKLWEADPSAKENKKLIYYLCTNTEGYMVKVRWKESRNFPLKGCWKYTKAKPLGQKMHKYLKPGQGRIHTYETWQYR